MPVCADDRATAWPAFPEAIRPLLLSTGRRLILLEPLPELRTGTELLAIVLQVLVLVLVLVVVLEVLRLGRRQGSGCSL